MGLLPPESRSIRLQARVTGYALLAILSANMLLLFFQARIFWKSAGEKSTSANSIPQAMQARLNGMSFVLMTYLHNHDPQSLEQIQAEGHEALGMLKELQQKAVQEGEGNAYAQVEKAYEEMREATLTLLAKDHDQVNAHDLLTTSSEALMSILIARIEPSIKPSQLNASDRLEAVLAASAEAKCFSKNAVQMTDLEESQRRFNTAVDTYARLSHSHRADHWAEETKTLFDQCMIQAQDFLIKDQQTQAALQRYSQRRNVLDVVFQESWSSRHDGTPFHSFRQVLSSGAGYSAFVILLLIVAGGLVLRASVQTARHLVNPLHDILQCAQAAVTGDVSRIPAYEAPNEMGQLATAVGRLIKVLGRSENLVYHLAALVDSSGEAIISHTLDGTILSWNKGAQRMYGYSADEVKGQSIGMLAPYDGGGVLMRNLQRVRRGERVAPFETVHQASNGRSVRALVRISAILDSTRKVIGASFCAQDLAEIDHLRPNSIQANRVL